MHSSNTVTSLVLGKFKKILMIFLQFSLFLHYKIECYPKCISTDWTLAIEQIKEISVNILVGNSSESTQFSTFIPRWSWKHRNLPLSCKFSPLFTTLLSTSWIWRAAKALKLDALTFSQQKFSFHQGQARPNSSSKPRRQFVDSNISKQANQCRKKNNSIGRKNTLHLG